MLSAGERAIDNPEEIFEKIPDAVSFEYLDSIGMTVDVAQRSAIWIRSGEVRKARGMRRARKARESREARRVRPVAEAWIPEVLENPCRTVHCLF